MTQSIQNTTAPSIQFSQEESTERGRDHTAHPLSAAPAAIPLTKTETTDSTKSRRSSLAAFADRLRSRSRSKSRSRSQRNSIDGDEIPEEFEYSTRKSSDMTGEYGEVIRAQTVFMEKLRKEQAEKHITHNVDGIPIPPPVNHQRRRSSLSQILGLEKPLLAL
ncbi:hypothetical protein BKA57DRAFT_446093 [Linnemannia elongata]|nr:hypothetical protein BGZ88_007954 [Linnemannia elongata]KAF9339432.1 hypothetical protein BGZ91_005925 [Linnemannia elongata]KAH7059981.1 hypothetical protein BKA57DRAFT_446093 [Linnemannia elongata]